MQGWFIGGVIFVILALVATIVIQALRRKVLLQDMKVLSDALKEVSEDNVRQDICLQRTVKYMVDTKRLGAIHKEDYDAVVDAKVTHEAVNDLLDRAYKRMQDNRKKLSDSGTSTRTGSSRPR